MHKLWRMKKPAVVVLLTIMIISLAAGAAWAEGEKEAPAEDEGGVFERTIAKIVDAPCKVIESLFQWGKFKTLDELVFMRGLTEDQKKNLPWEGNEPKQVRLWFNALLIVTAPFFMFAVVVTGFRLLHSAANPATRAEVKDDFTRWIIAVGIVALAPLLVSTLMWISSILVEAINGAFQSVAAASGLGRAVSDWGGVNVAGMNIVTGSVLGTAVVRLFLLFMFAYLNCLYIIRKVALTVFFCFTPIMAIIWCINKNTTAFSIWIGELASNAFMPVAHGLVLCTILLLCDVKSTGSGSWLTMVIMLYALIPTAEAIRNSLQSIFARWAGLNEEATAGKAVGAVMGLGGVMSMARVGKATFGGGKKIPQSPGRLPPSEPPAGTAASASIPLLLQGKGKGMPPSSSQQAHPKAGALGTSVSASIPAAPLQGETSQEKTRVQSTSSPSAGDSVLQRTRTEPNPRYERAVRFGSVMGKAAGVGAGAFVGMVAGAVPGGQHFVKPIAAAVGAGTRMAATGIHLAGGYVAQKGGEKIAEAAQRGSRASDIGVKDLKTFKMATQRSSETAQAFMRAGQRVKQGLQHTKVQRAADMVRKGSIVIQAGVDPEGAARRARYIDTGGSLDGPRER